MSNHKEPQSTPKDATCFYQPQRTQRAQRVRRWRVREGRLGKKIANIGTKHAPIWVLGSMGESQDRIQDRTGFALVRARFDNPSAPFRALRFLVVALPASISA
ncbi:MAG: hypothetical protein ACI4QJ_09050 [Candidatus Spyradenecus sp.]